MRKEIADRWVAALRSGAYKQGKNCLRNGDQFCCLGVLCDVVKSNLKLKWVDVENTKTSSILDEDGKLMHDSDSDEEILPKEVKEFVDMKSSEGNLGTYQPSLAATNDMGKSFPEIADIIEKNWEQL